MSAELDPTAAELRCRADDTVAGLLRENAGRWRSLSARDRLTVEALARDVAARLLDDPLRRLGRATTAEAAVVAELFALDQSPSETPRERRTRASV